MRSEDTGDLTSPSVATLITRGRTTGGHHTVKIKFLSLRGELYGASDSWGRDWCRNVLADPGVTIARGHRLYEGEAVPIRSDRELRSSVLRKLGYDALASEDLSRRAVFRFENLTASSLDYYELLEKAFDEVTPHYDPHIGGSFINRWMRFRSIEALKATFTPGDLVLDIGCGTGTESLALAREGVEILGIDISQEMVERFNAKADRLGLSSVARAEKGSTQTLDSLLDSHGEDSFDGAYSNFGALNLEPDLARIPPILDKLVDSDGSLVMAVWNKYCLFEIVLYTVTARPRKIIRRIQGRLPVGVRHFEVPTLLYSVGELKEIFEPYFRVRETKGIPVFLPPPQLDPYYDRVRSVSTTLESVDLHMSEVFPFSHLGDHSLLVMDHP